MDQFAILALLDAKAGKEHEVEEFLKSALPLAQAELGTTSWYALKLSPSKFAIFDSFPTENARDTHLSGEIAKALFAKATELFIGPPKVEMAVVLAVKAWGA